MKKHDIMKMLHTEYDVSLDACCEQMAEILGDPEYSSGIRPRLILGTYFNGIFRSTHEYDNCPFCEGKLDEPTTVH